MALSNTHGWLVLATGNKSEMAVGYATIYGDMVGGFALLKDVFKTDVFRLSRHLNERAGRELIPVSTIERPPTAELRADQRDDQSLPPYEVLDPVLEAYVELDRSREELEEQFDPAIVARTLALVDRAEYKRRQAAPGVKLRPRAFGRDWRTPITNRWRGADAARACAPWTGFSRLRGAPVISASASHGRQFRTVGRRLAALRQRLHQLRARLPVRDAHVELAPTSVTSSGRTAERSPRCERRQADLLGEERRRRRAVGSSTGHTGSLDDRGSSFPVRATTGTSGARRLGDRASNEPAAWSPLPEA